MRYLIVTMHLLGVLLVAAGCHHRAVESADAYVYQAYQQLFDISHHKLDRLVFTEGLSVIPFPDKHQTRQYYEDQGYVTRNITLPEIDRQLEFLYQVIALSPPPKCFVVSIDIDFSLEDLIFNVEPCLPAWFSQVKDQLYAKYSAKTPVHAAMLSELNRLLKQAGSEFSIIQTFADNYTFIFYPATHKAAVQAIFKTLGLPIGDTQTRFESYEAIIARESANKVE